MQRLFSLLFACILVLSLAACGNTGDQPSGSTASPPAQGQGSTPPESGPPEQDFDPAAYKALVSSCRTAISEAGGVLTMIGIYEHYYWESCEAANTNIYDLSSSDIIDAAFEWLAENTDETRETVNAAYDSIRQQYRDIALIEPKGTQAEEIGQTFRSMYTAYSSMYSLTGTPAGCRISFATMIKDYADRIAQCDAALALLLDA